MGPGEEAGSGACDWVGLGHRRGGGLPEGPSAIPKAATVTLGIQKLGLEHPGLGRPGETQGHQPRRKERPIWQATEPLHRTLKTDERIAA